MHRKSLNTELRWFALCFVAIVFVGGSFGFWREAALLCLACYVIWLVLKLRNLESWIYQARSGKIPRNTLTGVTGEIAEDVKLMAHRHAKEKAKS